MRLQHAGAAKVTNLTAGLGATGADLVLACADLTNWPDGSVGPFYASLGKGTLTEEKVLCSGKSGLNLQVWTDGVSTGRGADGTVAQVHDVNTTVEHVWTALEADAANVHTETTEGAHGYPPSTNLVTLDGNQTITGVKTMVAPVLTAPVATGGTHAGGTHTDATHLSVAGVQAEAEFRVRNTYIGVGIPSDAIGANGDLYIDKG